MLEELLKYDKLGNKDQLLFVLFDALSVSAKTRVSDLKKYCVSNQFSIGSSFDGILKLLEFISFITISDNTITSSSLITSLQKEMRGNYFDGIDFTSNLMSALIRTNGLSRLFNPDAVKFNSDLQRYYLKENLIPYQYFPLRNMLLSIGYFERDTTLMSNHLLIRSKFNESFIRQVIGHIINSEEKQSQKKISLEQLTKINETKNEYGRNAEIYALNFEQTRLSGHPKIAEVKRISDEYVNAGYDIKSYNDRESVIIDRYIEVKSFQGEVSFFWSKNEIATAKELGDKYFLYLVDRNKMSNPTYKPIIFQNPYENVFVSEAWTKEAESWKIELAPQASF